MIKAESRLGSLWGLGSARSKLRGESPEVKVHEQQPKARPPQHGIKELYTVHPHSTPRWRKEYALRYLRPDTVIENASER